MSTVELKGRHYLGIEDFTLEESQAVLALADELKRSRHQPWTRKLLEGRVLAMIFEKSSTRTRVSFEGGMAQMGGHAVFLNQDHSQLGRGEPLRDTARVLAAYCDAIMARVFSHATLTELKRYSSVPVINGLCDLEHPCQILGDLMTIREAKGRLDRLKVVFIGDGNNVAHSLMLGCAMFGMDFAIACPEGYDPLPAFVERTRQLAKVHGTRVEIVRRPEDAAEHADVIYTDVWASMGQEAETAKRKIAFEGYVVDAALMKHAKPDAVVMHCLPAHRGEEISDEVMESNQSVIFPQAENRLHVQKSLLVHLIRGPLDDAARK